jgi:solute:Na+ symporter, SSS family
MSIKISTPRRHAALWICLFVILLINPSVAWAANTVDASPNRGLGSLDWLVIFIYFAALIGVGLFYGRRQKTTEDYFVGGRRVSPFLVGISLYATMFSTLSYIGFPGELIQNGPILLCINLAAYPVVYFIVGYWIIPMVMKLPVTSAYELLETRLGRPVRLLGSAIFVLTRLIWMSIMLYTTSLVLVTVLGWESSWITPINIIAGVVTTFYTLSGGIRAVLVSDVVQFFVLLIGAVFTLVYITITMGGTGAWWPTQWAEHWAPQPIFSFDPSVRVTAVGTFIGALIWWVCISASDQMAIQRYLSTKDIASGRRAFLHNVIGGIVVSSILILLGLALLGFYQKNGSLFPADLSLKTQGDTLFPYFVSHFLPVGLPGLVMAGLLAASMSSLSSGINSSITVISTDFIDTFATNGKRSEHDRIVSARLLAAAIGLIAIGGSQLASIVPGNLIEVAGRTLNLLVCPLFGLFFLALFVPFATPFGAALGAIYSLTAAVLVAYWDFITGWPPISFQWIAPVALITTVTCSCLFSLLPTRRKSRAVLGSYTAIALLPLITLFMLLR